jgi:hypothetical protein
MKKLLFILFQLYVMIGFGQSTEVSINISLPTKPSANINEWAKSTPPLIIVLQNKNTPNQEKGSKEYKTLVTINSNGSKVCGKYTSKSAPSFDFNTQVKTWSGDAALGLLGSDCILKPGQYEFCVQIYNLENRLVGESCKPFAIADTKVEQINYTSPTLISPQNEAVFTEQETKKPLTFRWTPLVPKPKENVTYRLKVWQLMEGQTKSVAINANQPILTKEVENVTQAVISNWIGPCKFPYLCEFAWIVEAVNVDGKAFASSEPSSFKINASADITIVDFNSVCSNEFGKYTFALKAENPGNGVFNVTSINIAGATITSLSPSLPTIINPGSINSVTFTGGFTYSGLTYPQAVYATINGTQLGNTNLPSSDTEIDSLVACVCHDCDKMVVNLQGVTGNPTSNPNLFNVNGSVNISGLPAVYGIEMQILSYSYIASPSSCSNGINSVEQSCVFNKIGTSINGLPVSMMNETVSGLGSSNNGVAKNIKFLSLTPLPSSIPINLNIGLPSPITGLAKDCCKMTHKVCIKIKVFYDRESCKSCSYTYCLPAFNN